MFYYIRIRKKGSLNWKAAREERKMLVFNNLENAKKYSEELKDYVCKIVSLPYHPAHKRGSLYGKKYKKIGW
jgi:hypothetical protein